jgi:hypothetical protein
LASENHPGEQHQGVVIAGIAAEAVIVFVAAVELGVGDVLDADLKVCQRTTP